MYDLILKNGTVIDGTGRDAFAADIGIKGDRIARIGNLDGAAAEQVIHADGKVVSPGFIDMHSHADATILAYPTMDSMLHQGITTFVGCMCGHSAAPIGKYWEGNQAMFDILCELSDKLFPDMYDRDYYTPTGDTIPLIRRDHHYDVDWTTFAQWLDRVDQQKLSGNMVTLIGYNTLRLNCADPDRETLLCEKEKDSVKGHIREAMEAGAFGMSTGLDYKPGVFAHTPELLEMAAEMRPYDGIYFSHWRKTGPRAGTPKKQKKIDGICEVMDIGLANDIQVEISHLSAGFDVFPASDEYMQRAAAERTLQIIDSYISRGARAWFDVIPNITGGTIIAPDLIALFRPWYMYTGGVSLFVENLKHPDYRKQLSDHILAGKYFRLNPRIQPDWDEAQTVISCSNPERVGKTIREIASERGVSSLEQVYDLMVEDPYVKVFAASYSMTPAAVQAYFNHPRAMAGNDTFVFDLTSTIKYDRQFPHKKPNPNTYCGFIKYVTEYGQPRLEDTLHKITGLPAQVLGLTTRGLIKENYHADLVVIDKENLRTNENLIEPRVYPDGILHVVVNGQMVILDGKHTGKRPGGVIRRQKR